MDDPNMSTMINRRWYSKSAKERPTIPRGHPLAQMSYQGSRHMVPERLPSAKKERAVGLRVIDLNNDTVENIKSLSTSLRRLDISDLHLVQLSEDLMGGLTSLEKLDVSGNDLTDASFPPCCKNWEKLVELSAHDNQLTQHPKSLRKLKNLVRLKLGNNKIVSLEGFEKHKKLQVLVLEGNRIEVIPKEYFSNLKRLELLHCGHNLLSSIHPDIRHLRFLNDLDISNNKLTVLPPEVLLLPRIEAINASNNLISRMPSINVKGRVTRKLNSVDLSGNVLIKFPEHLMYLTKKLDLSRNKIKVIPAHTFKKIDWSTRQEVILHENPLTTPPPDICECGLRAIMQYFQEEKCHTKMYQGLKVMVLGDTEQGKTSLIQTIVDQQPRLTGNDARTIGVDSYDFVIDIPAEPTVGEYVPPADDDDVEADDSVPPLPPQDMPLNLSIYDFSGNKRYLFPHYFFLHQPSLCLLAFDLSTYDDSKFDSRIGSWIDFIIARSNQLIILPVGTHVDKLKAKQVKQRCDSVSEKITQHLKKHRANIEREIKKIESRPHISPALSEQLKLYISLLKLESHVYDRVMPVSSLNMNGMDAMLQSIEEMATQKEIFPNVLRSIPSLWGEVENYLEDRGYAMKVPVLPWSEYFEQVTKKFGMKHLMGNITQYLHDIGKVVWFAEHPTLKEFVFLRPSWIMECLGPIFRHDIKVLDYAVEESFKQCGIGVNKFESMKQELADEGIVDRDYLKCSLAHMIPTDVNRPLFEVATIFLQQFEIGYPLQKAGGRSGTASSKTSDNQRLDSAGGSRDSASPGPQRKVSDSTSPTPTRRAADTGSPSSARRDRTDSASTVRSTRQDNTRPESTRPGSSTSKSGRGGLENGEKDKTPPEPIKFTKILIPWLRVDNDPPSKFEEEYSKLMNCPSLATSLSFPHYIPPGFFETLTVRACKPEHNLTMLYHWRRGFYAKHVEKPVRLYLERVEHEGEGTCVRIEVKHSHPAGEVDRETEVLWSLMLPFLKDADDLVLKYTGED